MFNFFYTLNINKNYILELNEIQSYLKKYNIDCKIKEYNFNELNLDKVFDLIFDHKK